jgi:ribosome-binding ATPase YchF (GTP1/OBG family)
MRLGIIGLPQSGKTTIFNALTRGKQPVTASAGRMEVHTAVVDVPDERVDKLTAIFKPRKTIYAKVNYADVAGLEGGSKTEIAGTLLNQLSQMDGFIHVVRCFLDENVPHPQGSVDPVRDLYSMDEEFILNDQIKVEKKLAGLK